MLNSNIATGVPMYTASGEKKIDVAMIQVGDRLILLAFDEKYVNKGSKIAELTSKIFAQLDKKTEALKGDINEARDSVPEQGQDQTEGTVSELKRADVRGEDQPACS